MPEPTKIPMILRWYDGAGRLLARENRNVETAEVVALTGNPPTEAVRVTVDVALNPRSMCGACGADLDTYIFYRGTTRVCRGCFRRKSH